MSYILDALRKSERDRQQIDPLVLSPIASDTMDLPRRRIGWAGAIAALAIGVVVLAGYWTVNSHRGGAVRTPSVSVTTPNTPPKTMSVPETVRADKIRTEAKAIRPAPELKPSPFVGTGPRSTVRDLAKEARAERSVPQPAAPPPAAPSPTPSIESSAPAAPPVATTPVAAADESIKFLRAMPADFQRELHDLSVTIHIYAPNEADRILYINNRQYRAGEQVREGVVVEEIVPDGAVLTYHGRRFKLPRPT